MMMTNYNPYVYNLTYYNLTPQYTLQPSPQVSKYVEQSNLICPIQTIPQLPHIVQPKPMELHAEQSNSAYPMVQGFMVDRNTIYPPLFHCPGAAVSICCVKQMNEEQTGNWVRTYGMSKGWKEADTYAKSFRDNSITGNSLEDLNSKLLEEQLGMSDSGHRMELLSTIRSLFPVPPQGSISVIPAPQPLVASTMGSTCGSGYNIASMQTQTSEIPFKNFLPSPICSARRLGESDGESSYSCVSSTCDQLYPSPSNYMSESGYREQSAETAYSANVEGGGLSMTTMDNGLGMTTMASRKSHEVHSLEINRYINRSINGSTNGSINGSTSGSINGPINGSSNRSIRSTRRPSYKKLSLKLEPNQVHQDIDCIRTRFKEFYDVVTVTPVEGSDDSYQIAFEDCAVAQDAFYNAEEIGYKLTKKWPKRPNPSTPIKYRSMKKLTIRSGKAFSGPEVGYLPKDETVIVNQLKGRRARLIKEVKGEAPEVIGWVSVHSLNGEPLLVQEAEL